MWWGRQRWHRYLGFGAYMLRCYLKRTQIYWQQSSIIQMQRWSGQRSLNSPKQVPHLILTLRSLTHTLRKSFGPPGPARSVTVNIHSVWLQNICLNRKNVIFNWKWKSGSIRISNLSFSLLSPDRITDAKYKRLKIRFEAMDRLTAESGTGLKGKGRVWTG